jgi:hypothetical protein
LIKTRRETEKEHVTNGVFIDNQDYTRKIWWMGKSHSTTTYIIAAMVLGKLFLLRVTTNKDGKEEKKKRREESKKDNSCVYHQREKRYWRQPAGVSFISLLGR